jgi:hypothetical protein
MRTEFDVARFLDALGPRAKVAEWCGVARTAPYGWMRRGYLSSTTMAKLIDFAKSENIRLDVNKFFVRRRESGGKKHGRR